MKVLVISRQNQELERVPLQGEMMLIGRSPSSDIVLRAPKVSPCHFLLEWSGVGTANQEATDWSVVDISDLQEEGAEGFLLNQGAVELSGFKFEIVEDALAVKPEIGGRVLEFAHGESESYSSAQASGNSRVVELMLVRKDSLSLDEVLHLNQSHLKKLNIPFKQVSGLKIHHQKGRVVLSVPQSHYKIYNRGQRISDTREVELNDGDLLQIQAGPFLIYARWVEKLHAPKLAQSVVVDRTLSTIFLSTFIVCGALLWFLIQSRPVIKDRPIPPPPRMATIEIKEGLKEEPKKVEEAPPAPVKEAVDEVVEVPDAPKPVVKPKDPPRAGIPKLAKNDKPAEAAAPRYVKDPNTKGTQLGLSSPAKVTNANTVGILGAFAKASKGKGVKSDLLLNQGVVTQTISGTKESNSTVTLKNPPSGVLGTGSGGDPDGDEGTSGQLASASTTFAGGERYNPKSGGPISREGAKGEGWSAGTSLSKGGTGIGGGSLNGKSDLGSLESSGLSVEGGLDRESVRRVINANRGLIRTCYDRALLTNSKLAGRLLYGWKISPSGPVISAELKSSTADNNGFESCVLGVIKKMVFPVEPRGRATIVNYPFQFRPQN